MLKPITMYHGVWYATHNTVADTERKVNKEQVWKWNWQIILFGIILFAMLIIGGI